MEKPTGLTLTSCKSTWTNTCPLVTSIGTRAAILAGIGQAFVDILVKKYILVRLVWCRNLIITISLIERPSEVVIALTWL